MNGTDKEKIRKTAAVLFSEKRLDDLVDLLEPAVKKDPTDIAPGESTGQGVIPAGSTPGSMQLHFPYYVRTKVREKGAPYTILSVYPNARASHDIAKLFTQPRRAIPDHGDMLMT